ncbi:metallophosphoesterase [Sphingomonas canadensis]|uniref:Metallophosphoesterase n=1 Tax=Sphingomonas canadensis TaxID=1219257 RepID=A0ABW3H0I0_9SPHN|nr:metallophosphoesterase [Sphingomonas canadensis]MCW3835175.1 metallophosphoesterase [Sphingomonas canadensis]
MTRLWKTLLPAMLAAPFLVLGWGYANLLADPVRHDANVAMTNWPAGAPPLRVALIGDIHMQGPDMPAERVRRLAEQVNAAKPDLILLAGDYVGDRELSTRAYSEAEIAQALAAFRAPMGVWAVLGNHDNGRRRGPMLKALEKAGIPTLENRVVKAGPLVLAGIGDWHSGKARPAVVAKAADKLRGPRLAFTHSPDVIPRLGSKFGLVLAAHTHCGQIVLPLIGPVASSSRYSGRYRCGVVREGARVAIITGGWGASVLPLRYGAPPDWWLLKLGGVSPPRS